MPILFIIPAISEYYPDIAANDNMNILKIVLYTFIGIFYLSGEPILPHLLRYRAFAVNNHSCIPCASHLQQPRLVNNPGWLSILTILPSIP